MLFLLNTVNYERLFFWFAVKLFPSDKSAMAHLKATNVFKYSENIVIISKSEYMYCDKIKLAKFYDSKTDVVKFLNVKYIQRR